MKGKDSSCTGDKRQETSWSGTSVTPTLALLGSAGWLFPYLGASTKRKTLQILYIVVVCIVLLSSYRPASSEGKAQTREKGVHKVKDPIDQKEALVFSDM